MGLTLVAVSLVACTAQRTAHCGWEGGKWVRTDLPAYIHREHPVPGSDASEAALLACEQGVTPEARALAEGHLGTDWSMPSPPKGVDTDTFKAGLLLCYLNPFCWPLAPAMGRMGQSWTPEEAAAREVMAREIGQCMDDQGWIYCRWHKERSGLALGYRGPGWLCRRKRIDDPQPE